MKLTLGQISDQFDLPLYGDASIEVSGIASLQDARSDQLTFLFSSGYRKYLPTTRAACVVLAEADRPACSSACLVAESPRLAWARIATVFDDTPKPNGKHHPSAIVDPAARIGAGVTIGANVVIEAGVKIGDGSAIGAGVFIGEGTVTGNDVRLFANVSVYHGVRLGNRVTVHSGAVLGADGFGFEFDASDGTFVKIPQTAGLVIGDDVEIGAGTTIDRGALNDTQIGDGVKIDNQVQIGHNTRVGHHTVISGCTAIAGSTTIGSYCLIGGGVGIVDNIMIADQVEITAMSLVSQSITKGGRYSSGTGLMPGADWKRNIVVFKQLSGLLRRVRRLETGSRE